MCDLNARPSRSCALLLWCILLMGQFVSSMALGLIPKLTPTGGMFWSGILFYLPFALLPLMLLRRRGKLPQMRNRALALGEVLSISLAAIIGLNFFQYLTVLWVVALEALGIHPGLPAVPLPADVPGRMLCVLSVAALPAAAEELLFRGTMLPAFERAGTKRAVLLSAALFMLTHGTLSGMPMQFVVGVVLALVTIWFDSIYAGMIYHCVHNAANLIQEFLLANEPISAAEASPERLIDMLGGANGLFSLLLNMLITGGLLLWLLRGFRRRAMQRGYAPQPPQRVERKRSERALMVLGLCLSASLYALVNFFV